MDENNPQNPEPTNKDNGSMGIDANDPKIGSIIYFLGIIIISTLAVGWLAYTVIGLL